MDIKEKINALMEKEEFVEAFKKVENEQEVIALFKENGIDVPEAIAMELFEPAVLDEEELSESDLEDVAGGGKGGSALGGVIGQGVFYGAGYLGARLAGWSKSRSKKYATTCSKFGSALGAGAGYLLPF